MLIRGIEYSATPPRVKGVLWAKPVTNGFVLYMPVGSLWKPLQIVNDNSTTTVSDDVAKGVKNVENTLIGSIEDEKTADTINGAKAYAEDAVAGVIGDAEDTWSAEVQTLNALKNYIDSKVPESNP